VGFNVAKYHASLGSKWNMELHSELCLSARSYKVHRIDKISERFDCCAEAPVDTVKQLLMWHDLAFQTRGDGGNSSLKPSLFSSMAQRYRLGMEDRNGQRKEMFLRTLLGDYIHPEGRRLSNQLSAGRRVNPDDVSHIEEWWDWLVAKPTATSGDQYNQWKDEGEKFLFIHKRCVNFMFHKRFFVTESERFGLDLASEANWGLVAWQKVFQDDEIHILEGCSLLVLLRPLEVQAGKFFQPASKSRGGGKGKAGAKEEDGDPKTYIVQRYDHDLRANSVIYSAPLNKCCHNKDKVYQFSGLCYVHGLMDGEALQAKNLKQSVIYLR
jgi:hypothetical protein